MSINEETNSHKFLIGEEVVCPLVINSRLVKHNGYNVPTIGIIKEIADNYVVVEDKYGVFLDSYSLKTFQLEKILDTNDWQFYVSMIEKSKNLNEPIKCRFSYGPSAATLHYLDNEINYCLTFDYSFERVYLSGISNILDINLNNINFQEIESLDENLKSIFKTMNNEMLSRTEKFTFSNIPKLLEKFVMLC